jgi:hypothetical protein
MNARFWNKYLYNANTGEAGATGGEGGSEGGGQSNAGAGGVAGAPPTDWFSALPETVRGHEKLKGFKSGDEVLDFISKASTPVAVPETYTLPEGVPAETGAWAKGLGLSQAQLEGVLKQHQQVLTVQEKAMVESNKAATIKLFESWGAEKDAKLQLANRVLAMSDPDGKLGVAKFMQSRESGYAMMNPLVIQMFANIAEKLKEHGFVQSGNPGTGEVTKKTVHVGHEMYPDLAPKK